MRKASKILLYIGGGLGLLAVLSTLVSLVAAWVTNFLNVGINITLLIMIAVKVPQDVVNTMLQFTSVTSIYKMLLQFMGVYGGEAMSNESLTAYLITDSILQTVSIIISTFALVLPIIIAIIGSIFSLQAAGNKGTKKRRIRAIVGGGLVYVIANQLIGLLIISGGVLGLIMDNKEENAEKEENQVEEASEVVEAKVDEIE